MIIYNNRKEVVDELASNLRVEYKPYGTWRISSYLGSKWRKEEGFIEEYYDSHNEEDSIGIFDGAKYYPQDFNEWLKDYAQYEIEDYEHYHEEELKELFEEWCERLWSDSSNEDNYEPDEERENRLAENLFDLINDGAEHHFLAQITYHLEEDIEPRYLLVNDEEEEFIYSLENGIELVEEGKFEELEKLFKEWKE